jgi:hypothetical protein
MVIMYGSCVYICIEAIVDYDRMIIVLTYEQRPA